MGARPGAGGGLSETGDAKKYVRGLIGRLLIGQAERGTAAVVFQGINTLARLIELERRIREQDEIEEQLAALEEQQPENTGGGRAWHRWTGGSGDWRRGPPAVRVIRVVADRVAAAKGVGRGKAEDRRPPTGPANAVLTPEERAADLEASRHMLEWVQGEREGWQPPDVLARLEELESHAKAHLEGPSE